MLWLGTIFVVARIIYSAGLLARHLLARQIGYGVTVALQFVAVGLVLIRELQRARKPGVKRAWTVWTCTRGSPLMPAAWVPGVSRFSTKA